MKIFPLHAADFYKTGHLRQYPEGTEYVYSNFTARSDKLAHMLPDFDHKVVFAGLQGVIQWLLIELWDNEFFKKPKQQVVERFRRRMDLALGVGAVATKHIEALHDLGYLPLEIRALAEGSRVNLRVPMFTIINTRKEFYWLTNYIETQLSAELWKTITSATIANEYRRLLDQYAEKTGSPKEFVPWQGHDFSARGQCGIHDGAQSGLGHLLSFTGTDTISALDYVDSYYSGSEGFIGGSVPATEHSVMCMGGKESEINTFKRLITELYPSGIISIVSDSWDYWKVINEYARTLKEDILARKPDGLGFAKVVFRPDSGDPVKIICGDRWSTHEPAVKGTIECLWDIFGGTVTDKGYKVLNQRVGVIYGDSITLQRAQTILAGLERKGFASCNIVFGIGSFTYQHVTRDTFGHAYKCTWGMVNGEDREIFKDPATGDGIKKSAKGLVRVEKEGKDYVLYDQQTFNQSRYGELKLVFDDGQLYNFQSLFEIRERLRQEQ